MMSEKARAVVVLLMFCSVYASSSIQQLTGPTSLDYVHRHRFLLADNSGVASNLTAAPKQDGGGRGLNPSVVIIVVILTVVFLLSGFLHLLARCCGRVAARRESTESAMSALHGQLQHLFHLHDSGVDQTFIDTLPVFPYKAICGLKEGTDCAVCLSEFESEDRLRLLPKCKHAFHIDCIDTWLLSHSTCPLCRCALLNDDAPPGNGTFSDSGRLGSTRSMRSEGYAGDSRRTSNMSRRMIASSSMLAEHGGGSGSDIGKDEDTGMGIDSPEIQPVLDRSESEASGSVLSVKLGRVERRTNHGFSAYSILRGRSYSMGSYEYVVDPANLQVVIAPTPYPGRGNSREFANGSRPRHRTVFSDGIPELGSIPGTPADELFWATRGMATPDYGALRGGMTPDFFNASTPDFLSSRTPDFITSKEEGRDGNGTSRLNLGHLASEASLVPREKQQQQDEQGPSIMGQASVASVEGKGEDNQVEDDEVEGNVDEFVTVDLDEEPKDDEIVRSCSFEQRASSPLQDIIVQVKAQESEESRVMAGLERFFGTGWRSNIGLEKLAESMAKRDKAPQDSTSNRSRPTSDQGGESLKDHSVSSRAFSFRFPVPEGISKLGRNRRSFSETAAIDSKELSMRSAFESASRNSAGNDTGSKSGSKDGGFESASKESLGGLDISSVGSFDSSWMVAPPQAPTVQDNGINHNESNQQASSLARKTIHWLMGRDRRVQVYASNFSPSTDVAEGNNHRSDENL
ncbi:unnamed protein product [Calypogeia fissa]